MAVGADDDFAGAYQSLFRQEGVLDAHHADIEEVHDAVFFGEFLRPLDQGRGIDILGWCEMVHDKGDFFPVEDFVKSGFFEFIDGHRRSHVVAQDEIQVDPDQFPGLDGIHTAVCRNDFLRHCHSH